MTWQDSPFFAVLRRDLLLLGRGRADAIVSLLFFVLVACLFPLGVGADASLLRTLGPGVLWVAALLATLLSQHRLFAQDHADGTLEQLLLSPGAATLWVLAKITAHWIGTGLPLVTVAPLMGLLFDLGQCSRLTLSLSFALGTPVLALVGAIGAALALGMRGGGVLQALLLLPWFVPVLIFGAGSVSACATGQPPTTAFLLLGGALLAALALAPPACVLALRFAVEE
ncbi:heme exporter protein CcmB [Achromobacter xylosoxidans]|uniref:heme exporter protein CcmB n=1 Tax=Alcaligenes xylosoxydans xylosoxydans TaxID=85698 RepID=UPI0011DCCDE9|nr:heme exporter protein CcmB [Achromobacter xylosoxidans]